MPDPDPLLRLHLLGPPRVEVDGVPIEVDTRKAIALLAYLAVTGRPQSRDHIAGLLWPEYGQERARAALRRTLSALRTALGGGWVVADRNLVRLDPAGLDSDVDAALAAASRRLSLDPLNEAAHRDLMRLYAARGERSAAVHQYRECVAILERELGVAPLPETTALYEAITQGDDRVSPPSQAAAPPATRGGDPLVGGGPER